MLPVLFVMSSQAQPEQRVCEQVEKLEYYPYALHSAARTLCVSKPFHLRYSARPSAGETAVL